MDLLGDYRTEIDKIDKEMTKLLEKRMNISKSISKYKMEHDMQIFHPEREKIVIEKNKGYLENKEYGKMYKKLYNLDTYGMRYFNVFGRRQDPNGAYAAVIPKFLKQLMNDEAPTINGDGRQSRDFTYIDNVIEANLKACLASSEVAGEAYNVASGGREYLIDIYYNLCSSLGKNIEPVFGPDRKGDIKHSNADISKARKFLGYDPEYNFSDGIKLAIEWYKENL